MKLIVAIRCLIWKKNKNFTGQASTEVNSYTNIVTQCEIDSLCVYLKVQGPCGFWWSAVKHSFAFCGVSHTLYAGTGILKYFHVLLQKWANSSLQRQSNLVFWPPPPQPPFFSALPSDTNQLHRDSLSPSSVHAHTHTLNKVSPLGLIVDRWP